MEEAFKVIACFGLSITVFIYCVQNKVLSSVTLTACTFQLTNVPAGIKVFPASKKFEFFEVYLTGLTPPPSP